MICKAAIDLIKISEGFRAEAYKDAVGIWTIGYGTTAMAGVGIDPKAGMKITEKQAEVYLTLAVDKFAAKVKESLNRSWNENQLGAMVSLAYNIGPAAFARSSVARKFNENDIQGAAYSFLLWDKAGGKVLKGLQIRRAAERKLFLMDVSDTDIPTSTNGFAAIIAAIIRMFGKVK